ncbi:RNA-binding protein 39-like [Impatiens glandulifera]|uniref:RNA-binding protein 39-like n=1 Tax=Impatiens glandulifera TaxID=253017 RepID=UPI001FB0E94C|nr:RNA-binding protein 39-like [Impatiens glandulifera]
MDFDEYEYLEKTVEETERDASSSKKNKDKDATGDKNEKGYKRRDRDEEDGSGDDEDLKIKKSRADYENGGRRDKDDRGDRSSRSERHRSSRDRDVEIEKDRRRSNRDRDRESDRDKDRGSREKDKDRDRRDKEKERERERSRRSRSRSRSKSSRRIDYSDRDREREILREKERELESRESRRYKDKKEAVEPEHDPERDQRTVFAFQMPLKATERDVYEFFSKAGKVRDVRLIMDRNSRRSKGVGYIEFYDAMSVPMAIALTGQLLMGQPVIVKPSEAEKNLVQSNTTGAGSAVGPYGAVDRKLYVGNLHFNMTELQLKQIFEAFGPVELVQLPTDPETGHCKGFGFIQFAKLEDSKAALTLNGQLEIAGRVIKVSSVTDHVGVQDSGAKAADFDDDDGGGLALNAQSRALLMQKLDRSGTATSITGSIGVAVNGTGLSEQQGAITLGMNGVGGFPAATVVPAIVASLAATEPIGKPSECLLLKNMFDPSAEMDPEFDMEIKDDVEEECSKYGHVLHIHVDKNSAGYVYLRFETIEAASGAQAAMHKRWFARRLISAVFLQPYEYDAKFKRSA